MIEADYKNENDETQRVLVLTPGTLEDILALQDEEVVNVKRARNHAFAYEFSVLRRMLGNFEDLG